MKAAIAFLAALAIVLSGILGLELAVPDPKLPSQAALRGPVATSAAPAAPAARADEWVATILARPLFETNRRGPSVKVQAPAAEQVPPWPRVTGILVSPKSKTAIFSEGASGTMIAAAEGARIGAYTVQSIQAGSVTVSGPRGTRALIPAFDSSSPRPATLPAGPLSMPAGALGRFGLPSLPGLPALPPLPGAAPPTAPPSAFGIGIPGLTGLGAPAARESGPPPSLSIPGQTGQESPR